MDSGDAPGGGDLAAEVLAGRLASPVAASCTLKAARALVAAMPREFAVDTDVYAELQRLADEVETAIGAGDCRRRSLVPDDGGVVD
jgi:hypothetical protein